jgi:hypothetical protein
VPDHSQTVVLEDQNKFACYPIAGLDSKGYPVQTQTPLEKAIAFSGEGKLCDNKAASATPGTTIRFATP